MYLFKLISTASLLTGLDAAATQFCKRDPTSSQWPSIQEWQALNSSVLGALRTPMALASVCHPSQPDFNNATCGVVQTNWSSTDWVASNGWGADYNDETCLPNAMAPCSTAGYPAYVVEANTPGDVATAVKFANDHQVRLVVKGTGHDLPGRSSGPGSLSIWTHKLQGVNVTMGQPKAVQYGGVAAMKISAGMRMHQLYGEAAKHNITIVGGADPGVGIGGWITNGGHSPLSAKYGLGADQVLEMDVVTADGQILTIDENNHPDLFYAMRGGGSSTFAILLSVTVKAYATLPVTQYLFGYNTTTDSDTFWNMTAVFHAALPRIAESGGMGYYYAVPGGVDPANPQGNILGVFYFPQRTPEYANSIMAPLERSFLNNTWATDKITAGGIPQTIPDFSTMMANKAGETGGKSARLGSWLLDKPALTSNTSNLAVQLRKASPSPWSLLGNLVASPGTTDAVVVGDENAVLPAWRTAYVHLILPRGWQPLNLTQKTVQTRDLRDHVIPTVKSLAPNSGAYRNEADPTNPDWKHDYYGATYDRLLAVKNKWDPNGVFWCKPCVGYDQWQVVDGPVGEDVANWGVGQVGGRICRQQ